MQVLLLRLLSRSSSPKPRKMAYGTQTRRLGYLVQLFDVYISPLNQLSHDVISVQLSTIQSLSGKIPVDINILKVEEVSPTGRAVFPVSADAIVYLEVKGRIQNAGKEAEKFKSKLTEARREQVDIDSITADLSKGQDKDVAEARQSAERRKRDVGATLWALETVTVFEKMII